MKRAQEKEAENKKVTDPSTEGKIKEAARAVFLQKGFAGTRTRDIAEEAGINLALLNYYFRSKAKLFEIILIETLTDFIRSILAVLNDPDTSLDFKVQEVVSKYIDLLTKEPDIPTFILSEIRSNPGGLVNILPIKSTINRSEFFRQHQEAVAKGAITEPNPLHFLINLIGLIVFPFAARPLLMASTDINTKTFNNLMQERKKLIPIWIKSMMQAT